MSRLLAPLARVRYRWTAGTGAWASGRQHWASLPGRRFTSVVARGGPLTIAYQGFPEGLTHALPYLIEQQSAVAGPVSTVESPAVTWGQVRGGLRPPRSDLVVIGCSNRRAGELPQRHAVLLPFRVHLLLDIVGDAEAMYQQVSGNERRQFAKLRRKYGWAADIGAGEDDLRFFYERMHLPTMALRHGGAARSTDWAVAQHALFRHGFLLFVNEGGKRVAGVLCRLEDSGRTMRMRLLGVLDGDETHYRSGAVKAVYYLAMEWAAGSGVSQIDFSGAEPFPGKGVFQFKRRFHPAVVHAADHFRDRRLYLRATADSPQLRDLLVATPMLTVDGSNRLVGTHFFDHSRPARTNVRCDGRGVHDTRLVDLDEFLAGLPAGAGQTPHAAERVISR